jgi:hypothetical protein
MKRQHLYTLGAVLLASAALTACAVPAALPPNATPAQAAAARASANQARFDAACKYGGGIWSIAKPYAATVAAAKLGDSGKLAVGALDAFVSGTCKAPLDIANADAIIQRGYDVAGEVVALVLPALVGS